MALLKIEKNGIKEEFLNFINSEKIRAYIKKSETNFFNQESLNVVVTGRLSYFLDEIKIGKNNSEKEINPYEAEMNNDDFLKLINSLSCLFVCNDEAIDAIPTPPTQKDVIFFWLLDLIYFSLASQANLKNIREKDYLKDVEKMIKQATSFLEKHFLHCNIADFFINKYCQDLNKDKQDEAKKHNGFYIFLFLIIQAYDFCFGERFNKDNCDYLECIWEFKYNEVKNLSDYELFKHITSLDFDRDDLYTIIPLFKILDNLTSEREMLIKEKEFLKDLTKDLFLLNDTFGLGIRERIKTNEFNIAVKDGLNKYLKNQEKN